MPLTDTAISNAKPGVKPTGEKTERPYSLSDGQGLYLEVPPKGSKRWRYAYRFGGKEQLISLGLYPEVSLKRAREKLADARRLVADGINPSAHRKAEKHAQAGAAANTFELIAREWYEKQATTWVPAHGDRILRRFERDVFPWIGGKPVSEISAPDLLSVLRRIEERGAIETAHRALQNCGQVFRYAVATSRAESDPSRDLRGALAPTKEEHFASITDPKLVGKMLRALDSYHGTLVVKCALRLAPLVFVRPGELRKAKWEDFDLEAAEWRFYIKKTDKYHLVPLSTQAVSILRELQPLTGTGPYVFPNARSAKRPMSDNAVLSAMRALGITKEEMTGHGFRAMARTIQDEVLQVPPHLLEHQLAHVLRDPNGRAYNRTAHLTERRAMMQRWADYLDQLKAGAQVIELKRTA